MEKNTKELIRKLHKTFTVVKTKAEAEKRVPSLAGLRSVPYSQRGRSR